MNFVSKKFLIYSSKVVRMNSLSILLTSSYLTIPKSKCVRTLFVDLICSGQILIGFTRFQLVDCSGIRYSSVSFKDYIEVGFILGCIMRCDLKYWFLGCKSESMDFDQLFMNQLILTLQKNRFLYSQQIWEVVVHLKIYSKMIRLDDAQSEATDVESNISFIPQASYALL